MRPLGLKEGRSMPFGGTGQNHGGAGPRSTSGVAAASRCACPEGSICALLNQMKKALHNFLVSGLGEHCSVDSNAI